MPRSVTRYLISHRDSSDAELFTLEQQGPWDTQEEAEDAIQMAKGWDGIVLSALKTLSETHSCFNAYPNEDERDADTERTEVSSPRIIQWNEPTEEAPLGEDS